MLTRAFLNRRGTVICHFNDREPIVLLDKELLQPYLLPIIDVWVEAGVLCIVDHRNEECHYFTLKDILHIVKWFDENKGE